MISQYRKGTGINMINFEEELKNFKECCQKIRDNIAKADALLAK